MAVKIFGAAEGFLPKACMPEKLAAANTRQGPRIQKMKMMIKAILRLIYSGFGIRDTGYGIRYP